MQRSQREGLDTASPYSPTQGWTRLLGFALLTTWKELQTGRANH